MWVDLIRMREAGQKRPKERLLRDRPTLGRLTLESTNASETPETTSERKVVAFFRVRERDLSCDVVYRLDGGRVTAIGEDSLVVSGIERLHMAGGGTQDWPQSWWCRVAAEPSAEEGYRRELLK